MSNQGLSLKPEQVALPRILGASARASGFIVFSTSFGAEYAIHEQPPVVPAPEHVLTIKAISTPQAADALAELFDTVTLSYRAAMPPVIVSNTNSIYRSSVTSCLYPSSKRA